MADILRDVGKDPVSYRIPDDELPSRICMHAGLNRPQFAGGRLLHVMRPYLMC